jgi:hypothetical protein
LEVIDTGRAAGVCPDRVLSRRGGDSRIVVGETARGLVAVVDAQFSPRPVAIGVDRSLGHAQLAGDLLGTQVAIDQPQAFPLSRGEQFYGIVDDRLRRAHKMSTLTTRARFRLDAMVALATLALDFSAQKGGSHAP